MLLTQLFQNPEMFFFVVLALIIAITGHEFSHAYAADRLGDPTARYLGRVSLNPLKHLDPIGSLMLLVVGIGWGRPVPFNPDNLANPKRDSAIISFAGPLSNFVLAGVIALVYRLIGLPSLAEFAASAVFYNLMLGVFNLLPFHPLDGFKIVYGLLPFNLAYQWLQMQNYGIYILIFMMFTGTTGRILQPLIYFSFSLLGF